MTQVEAPLFCSPWGGLLPFQEEQRQICCDPSHPNTLAVWDMGTGKSVLALATACSLIEAGKIDHVLICCELNKIGEWSEDIERFTQLTHAVYHGSPKKREKLREQSVQVLLSTYETVKSDAAIFPKKFWQKRTLFDPGPLTLAWEGRNIFVVYDEMTKLKNRQAQNFKGHRTMLNHWRSAGNSVVLGLTGTPIESGPEDLFNLGLLLCPESVGTVGSFDTDHVVLRDVFEKPIKFKNLSPDFCDAGVRSLAEKLSPVLLRKSKNDPDVVDQFPEKVEEFIGVTLGDRHLDFYNTVAAMAGDVGPIHERTFFGLERQIAGHPLSMLRSQGGFAKTIAEAVGESGLRALGSAKLERLISYLQPVVQEGHQTAIFTFYGQSILPLIQERLEAEGISVVVNHGQMNQTARDISRRAFNSGDASVFLSSDAGARGINLPTANFVINYELPLTFAMYSQRIDRAHRIGSGKRLLTCVSFIARDTIEVPISRVVMKRNTWAEDTLDSDDETEGGVSAADRRKLLQEAIKVEEGAKA